MHLYYLTNKYKLTYILKKKCFAEIRCSDTILRHDYVMTSSRNDITTPFITF